MWVGLTGLMREPGLLGKRLAAGDDTPDGLMAAGGAVRRGGGREGGDTDSQAGRKLSCNKQTMDRTNTLFPPPAPVLFCSVLSVSVINSHHRRLQSKQ